MSEPVLEALEVSVSLGGAEVLKAASLSAEAGRVVALVGPNGSGKSTLVRTLTGLIKPAAGQVRLDGRLLDSWPLKDRARRIGYLAQDTMLTWDLTVAEVVALGARGYSSLFDLGAAWGDLDLGLCKDLEIDGFLNRRIASLSGGERARVLLARVLAGRPGVLLADEPAAHLDVAHQASIMRHIRRDTRERGMAAVVVVHDLNLAGRFADRIVVLSEGTVALDAPADEALGSDLLDQVFGQTFARVEVDGRRALIAKD